MNTEPLNCNKFRYIGNIDQRANVIAPCVIQYHLLLMDQLYDMNYYNVGGFVSLEIMLFRACHARCK